MPRPPPLDQPGTSIAFTPFRDGQRPRSRAHLRGNAVAEPIDAATDAGLRSVSDESPGIRRIKRGSRFTYLSPAGKPIKDDATLARIRSLTQLRPEEAAILALLMALKHQM
jgi:DNA topoisomerase IB